VGKKSGRGYMGASLGRTWVESVRLGMWRLIRWEVRRVSGMDIEREEFKEKRDEEDSLTHLTFLMKHH